MPFTLQTSGLGEEGPCSVLCWLGVHVNSTFTWWGHYTGLSEGSSSFLSSTVGPSPLPAQVLQPEPESKLGSGADPLFVLCCGWCRLQQCGHGHSHRSGSSILF